MDRNHSQNQPTRIERQLAHLKIISRLIGHELHAQTGPRLTLSREEMGEIQTSIDLFIEEFLRKKTGLAPTSELAVQAVPTRVN